MDYVTVFHIKYTSRFFLNKISSSRKDKILDLRNIKIIDENNTI